jgi:hypothetical protein
VDREHNARMGPRWVSLAERPELFEAAIAIDSDANLGGFTQHDEIGMLVHAYRLRDRWPDYFLVLVGDDPPPRARAVMAPLSLDVPGREQLPPNGWDGAVLWAVQDALDGVPPTAACALEINVDPLARGRGISGDAVQAMRDAARGHGLQTLIAPVRPPDKAAEPAVSMSEYASRRRPDGLPEDRWLRVHVRAGGSIVGVAPASMLVVGTLDDWRAWTGHPFDSDGPVEIAGGLVPVVASQALGMAFYAEPNVWVRHDLR